MDCRALWCLARQSVSEAFHFRAFGQASALCGQRCDFSTAAAYGYLLSAPGGDFRRQWCGASAAWDWCRRIYRHQEFQGKGQAHHDFPHGAHNRTRASPLPRTSGPSGRGYSGGGTSDSGRTDSGAGRPVWFR